MHQTVEDQVRALARPLWESAARPFGMAMDFWLMAEQMVLEVMAATTRLQSTMLSEIPAPTADIPAAAPVAKIRALAECMWEAAGKQYEMSQDFWLAAEKHVLAMVRAANGSYAASSVQEICTLSPTAYLERIRGSAYSMWDAAGRQYGRTLEFWLAAERQTLTALREAVAAEPVTPSASVPATPTASAVTEDEVETTEALAEPAVVATARTATIKASDADASTSAPSPSAAAAAPREENRDEALADQQGKAEKRKRSPSTRRKRPVTEEATGSDHG